MCSPGTAASMYCEREGGREGGRKGEKIKRRRSKQEGIEGGREGGRERGKKFEGEQRDELNKLFGGKKLIPLQRRTH